MTSATLSEKTVAKNKKPTTEGSTSPSPPFERVEVQVPPGWTAQVDAAAEALGMSRSAYIRMAVARQMNSDKKEMGTSSED